MDPRDFDSLARLLGSGQSRRQLLKRLAGSMVGAVAAAVTFDGAEAAKKRSIGNTCAKNADCLSNNCVSAGRSRKVCGCGSDGDCPQTSGPCLNPGTCDLGTGACLSGIKPDSTPCTDTALITFAICDGVCQAGVCTGSRTALITPTQCGACGNVCPGYQQADDNVTCSVQRTCTFSCQGESYDVNDDPSDGCEVVDSTTGNHTSGNAAYVTDLACNDSSTFLFSGMLPSDRRVHESPAIAGFDSTTGSAPDYFYINATGGLCTNDVDVTLSVASSSSPACYKLTVFTDKNTYSAQTNTSGVATISRTNGQYSDNTVVTFKVEKTCGTSVIEAPTYTVSGHL